jgi:hypothetical protein
VRWNIAHPRGHAKSHGGDGKAAKRTRDTITDDDAIDDADSAEYNTTVMGGVIEWNKGKAEHECDRLCRVNRKEYVQLDMCKPEVISWWKKQAMLSPKCKIDPSTGQEVCKDDFRCEASASGHLHTVDVSRTATYDCTKCDKQNEGLRLQCCNICEREICPRASKGLFEIAGKLMDTVICEGCDKKSLARIAEKHRNFCKDSPGSFACNYSASCSTGVPEEVISDRTYDCQCSPCAACGDHAAKSQCCADCLKRTCAEGGGTDKAREVCAGCAMI